MKSFLASINRILGALLVIAILGLSLTTLVGLSARSFWLGDLFANLRLQQVMAVIGLIAACLVLRRWRLLLFTMPLAAIHGWFLWPTLHLESSGGDGTAEFRVMLANVLTSNLEHEAIIECGLANKAEVIVILELSSALAQKLETAWAGSHPHQKALPQDWANFGIGVYSKWPFEKVDVFETTESVPSLAISFDQVRVIATHPLPPMDAEGFRERNLQLDDLARRVRDVDRPLERPTIVVGDLNLTPWSPIFTSFEAASGLRRAVTKGGGFTPTWYAQTDHPWWAVGLALDHALISSDLNCVSYHVESHVGSDHRPVIWGFAK